MLSSAHRLTHHSEFTAVMRSGKRAGRPRVVVHALTAGDTVLGWGDPARVGLIVSKAVGGSVVRHRVSRKLRHVMRDVVPSLPPGTFVVLRALAAAATATSGELEADVSAALRKLGFPRTPDSA